MPILSTSLGHRNLFCAENRLTVTSVAACHGDCLSDHPKLSKSGFALRSFLLGPLVTHVNALTTCYLSCIGDPSSFTSSMDGLYS